MTATPNGASWPDIRLFLGFVLDGLRLVQDLPLMDEWLTVSTEPSTPDKNVLQILSQKLRDRIHRWNGEELKIYFIDLLLNMVDFDMEEYRPFLERDLSVDDA